MRRAPDRARTATVAPAAEVALCLALSALGALVYGKFFGQGRYLVPLVGAAALAAAVAVLADLRSWRAWTAVPVAALAFVPYAAYVAFPNQLSSRLPGPAALMAVADGLVHGWARMLSIGLPADVTGELLVTPILLTWAVAFAAVLALRTWAALAPLLPPLLGFVAALALTAGRPERQLLVTGGLVLAGLVLALLRANRLSETGRGGLTSAAAGEDAVLARARQRWRPGLGRVAFGLPIVAVVTALGVAGAVALPIASGDHRFDPRNLRDQRLEVNDALSPLVQLKSQLRAKPPLKLFTVTLESATVGAPVDRLRTAALDAYDGALWTTDDRYIVTGKTLPPGQPLQGRVVRVVQRVTVDRLTGPFLPTAGRPLAVAARDLGFDPDSGVLVTSRPQLSAYRYVVESAVSKPTAKELETALPNPSPQVAALGRPPSEIPAELRALADQITARQTAPFGQLQSIERYLRDRFPNDLRGRPGHSYAVLLRMLSSSTADRRGFAEQHAAAFALLARIKGFPTRVAVGYLLNKQNTSGPGTYTVTSANAHAWPEVNFEGYGWVGFEPTDLRKTASDLEKDPVPGVGGETSSQAVPEVVPPEIVPDLDPNADPGASGLGARARRIAFWVAAIVMAPLGLFGLVVLAKQQRRRRRRNAKTSAGRVIGAWRETTDRLRERGVGATASLTADEVAERAESRLGKVPASPVAQLAPIVTAAIYAPFEPDPQAVLRAWKLESSTRRELFKQTPALFRVRVLADPRPLLSATPRRRRWTATTPAAAHTRGGDDEG